MFRIMSSNSWGKITEYFITDCPSSEDVETWPKLITFPVSRRNTQQEQEVRVREYLEYLKALEEATKKAKQSVVLGDNTAEE